MMYTKVHYKWCKYAQQCLYFPSKWSNPRWVCCEMTDKCSKCRVASRRQWSPCLFACVWRLRDAPVKVRLHLSHEATLIAPVAFRLCRFSSCIENFDVLSTLHVVYFMYKNDSEMAPCPIPRDKICRSRGTDRFCGNWNNYFLKGFYIHLELLIIITATWMGTCLNKISSEYILGANVDRCTFLILLSTASTDC